jgi:hypothetical protein
MCDALPKCVAHPSAIIFLKHYTPLLHWKSLLKLSVFTHPSSPVVDLRKSSAPTARMMTAQGNALGYTNLPFQGKQHFFNPIFYQFSKIVSKEQNTGCLKKTVKKPEAHIWKI